MAVDAATALPQCSMDVAFPSEEARALVIFPYEVETYEGTATVTQVLQRERGARLALEGHEDTLEVALFGTISRRFVVGETFEVKMLASQGDTLGVLFLYDNQGELLLVKYGYPLEYLQSSAFKELFPYPITPFPSCQETTSCRTEPSLSAGATLTTLEGDIDLEREVVYDIELFGQAFKFVFHVGVYIQGERTGACMDEVTWNNFAFTALRVDQGN